MYTDEMREAVRQVPAPAGVTMDIVDSDDYLVLVLYKGQIECLGQEGPARVANYINDVKRTIGRFGVRTTFAFERGHPD